MKPLTANLKHLYQCRSLLIWYGILLFGRAVFSLRVGATGAVEGERGAAAYLFLVAFVVGLLVANAVRDVMGRPFAFGLPGHERAAKTMLGVVGGAVALAIGCVFSFGASGMALSAAGVFVSSAGVAFGVYLIGAMVVFAPTWVRTMVMATIPAAICFGGDVGFRSLYSDWEASLLSHPAVWLLWGVAASAAALPWFRAERLARGICGRPWIGLTEGWNKAKAARVRRAQKAQGTQTAVRTDSEATYLDRSVWAWFVNSRCGGAAQEVWGQAFELLSRLRWGRVLFTVLSLFAMAGTLGYVEGAIETVTRQHLAFLDMIFLVPCVYIPQVPSPIFSTLSPAADRKGRLRRESFLGAVVLVGGVAAAALFVGVCRLLLATASALWADGGDLPFWTPDLRAVLTLAIAIALFLATRMLGPRRSGLFPTLYGVLVVGTGIVWLPALRTLPVAGGVLTALAVWALYVALAWHVAARKDLVR